MNDNPFEAPLATPTESEDDAIFGLPWEQPGSLIRGFFQTAWAIVSNPTRTFARTDPQASSDAASWYLLIAFAMTVAVGFLFLLRAGIAGGICGLLFGGFTGILGGPLLLLYTLVFASIVHVGLRITNSPIRTFGTTWRTIASTFGSTMLWVVVPVIGLVLILQAVYILVVGLAKMHGTSPLRVLPAVTFAYCCVVVFLVLLSIYAD